MIPVAGLLDFSLQTRALLGFFAALLAGFSIFFGYAQVVWSRSKQEWLINRFKTERLRQFHFQLILSELPMVVEAGINEKGQERWLKLRAEELDKLDHHVLRRAEEQLYHLTNDEAEDRPWISEQWRHALEPQSINRTDLEPHQNSLKRLLEILRQQRFGIQISYASLKRRAGLHSPATRAKVVHVLSDALSVILLAATAGMGVSYVLALCSSATPNGPVISSIVIFGLIASLSSAGIVGLRALKEGLLLSADAERYKWFDAAVKALEARFDAVDDSRKIDLLREMERLAYQEMRRFLISAQGTRFVV
jgi:hypothetical protein